MNSIQIHTESSLDLPDLTTFRTILSVQPHPDDTDIALGATVAALAAEGVRIIYLSVTDDAAGLRWENAGLSYPERVALRRQEQHQAAELLGVSAVEELGLSDAGGWSEYDARQRIVDVIRRIQPDLVLTCDPWLAYEAHGDHRKTGLATAEAVLLCEFEAVGTVPVPKGMTAPMVGFFFTDYPNTFVQAEVFRKEKFSAIGAHRSQFTPKELAELDVTDMSLGQECGAPHGLGWVEGLKLLPPGQLHIMPGTRGR